MSSTVSANRPERSDNHLARRDEATDPCDAAQSGCHAKDSLVKLQLQLYERKGGSGGG
jgi:hypothetical protein